ncbi:hypothetical protein RUM43_009543 [Polyplax serrata]|uniref:Protein Wnt n=1 Tax=Polyplax serrata TaxID=468196 RepID=A0AAN8NZQ5_POLSC
MGDRIFIWRAVGSQVITNPELVCKKTRRLRGQMGAICRDKALLSEIIRGVGIGTKECQYQFRNRRWNCTTHNKSLKKVLMRGLCRSMIHIAMRKEEKHNKKHRAQR